MFFATTLAHAAPCTDLDLVPAAPQVQGQAQTFDVMGATPGATVLLFRDGEDSPCPGPIAPHCLDLDGTSFVAGTVADGFGVASFQVTVPAALDSTNHGWQAVSQDCGPSELEQTTAASPVSCAYDPLDWSVACETGPMGCFLTGWFDTLYPSGMPAFGASLTVEQVRTGLSQANTNNRAALALALSVDADDLAFFGTRVSLGDQVVPSGPYAGFQLREVAVLALASSPVSAELGATAIQALQAHDQCGDAQLVMPGYPVFDPDPGPSDSGVTDSGVVDTDPPSDSAVVDTGAPDSGADPDSGAFGETGATGAAGDSGVDSGVVDTGWGDTGAFDSGTDPTAGGSGAPPETAAPDSGIPTDDSGVISDSGRVDTGIGGGDTADSGG
jgi:hypothetical protein